MTEKTEQQPSPVAILLLKFLDSSGKFDFSDLEWQDQLRKDVFPNKELCEWDLCQASLSLLRELEDGGYIELPHHIPVLVTPEQLEMIKEAAALVSAARLDNTVMSAAKEVIVDDSMVGIHFGVSSYEEFDPYVGPFERTGFSGWDDFNEWIENNPEEHKKNLWEGTRQVIHEELSTGKVHQYPMGIALIPCYTHNGQVIPPKPVPDTQQSYRDYQGQIVSFMPDENIVVDDDMVGACFGVKSYKDIEIPTWEKTGDPSVDASVEKIPEHFLEWVKKYPEEYKKLWWETIRRVIHMQMCGVGTEHCFVQNGQVIPNSIKNEPGLQGDIRLDIPVEPVDPLYQGEYAVHEYLAYPPGVLLRETTCTPPNVREAIPLAGRRTHPIRAVYLTGEECRVMLRKLL